MLQDNGNASADSITLGQLRAMVGTVPKPKVETRSQYVLGTSPSSVIG